MQDKVASGLRFGLIGCGDIGRLRAEAVGASGRNRLTAVQDADADRASGVASRHGAAREVDWRRLVERADVDAVIVSTPPVVHAEMAVAALEAGKHVLCEKPLARSPVECRLMVDAAKRTGRFLATGFNYRFYPSFDRLGRLLAEDAIGQLSHVRSYGGYSATSHNQPWVHDAEVVGGGALYDIGIHLIDLTRWCLGEVNEVAGAANGRVWGYPGCEDNGFVLMRSPGGAIATLHASWTEWGRYQFVIEAIGDRGRIRASCFPMDLDLIRLDRPGGEARRHRERYLKTFVGEHLRSYRWVVVRSFMEEFDAFARAVRGEPSKVATGYDGLRAIEIASAASGMRDARASRSESIAAGSTP